MLSVSEVKAESAVKKEEFYSYISFNFKNMTVLRSILQKMKNLLKISTFFYYCYYYYYYLCLILLF